MYQLSDYTPYTGKLTNGSEIVGVNGGTCHGGEAQDFLSLLIIKAAKDLQLDMSVKK